MRKSGCFSTNLAVAILLAMTLAPVFSCSNQPTANVPEQENQGGGVIDPRASGRFLLGTVADTSFGSGTIDVWVMNVAFDDATGMVTFEAQIVNNMQQGILGLPIYFVIKNIYPNDVAAVDFYGTTASGFPFYSFSDRLGGGDRLAVGEMTEPVMMKFHTVTARSFAIGFYLAAGPCKGGTIEGVVFLDANQDGQRDRECRCEDGISEITVVLEQTLPNGNTWARHMRTDTFGAYKFEWIAEGAYRLYAVASSSEWIATTPNPLLVTLVKGPDGYVQDLLGADFGLVPRSPAQVSAE